MIVLYCFENPQSAPAFFDPAFDSLGFTPLGALNQIKINRKQNIMVSCFKGVKSILDTVKSLYLKTELYLINISQNLILLYRSWRSICISCIHTVFTDYFIIP